MGGKGSMSDPKRLEKALSESNPVESLREIAVELSRSGLGKRKIYEIYFDFYQVLQNQERVKEEHFLGDVMDMIMNEYPPNNLNLPG
jgi:hypothetical protein